MDFGVLPPEVNSGRMYAGPGSGSMRAAAAAWDGLAAQLRSAAASYSSVVSGLTGEWQGPSSSAMAAAAAPYAAWLNATAVQAEQTATQARAAAAAYEAAFAAMVPPPVIAANRAQLASLVATNIVGQNIPAIAATEAAYADMWAQDAAAMYGYAGSSATAAQVTPFAAPPPTTNQAGAAAQSAAAGAQAQSLPQLMAAMPQTLQTLAAPAAAAAPAAPLFTPAQILQVLAVSFLNTTIGPYTPTKLWVPFGDFYDLGVQTFLAPFSNFLMQQSYLDALGGTSNPATGGGLPPGEFRAFHPGTAGGLSPGTGVVSSAGEAVSAGVGRAGLVGSLSVPQGWVSAAPAVRSVAAVFSETSLGAVPAAVAAEGQGSLFSNMALSGLAGRAIAGTGGAVTCSVGTCGRVAPGAATSATIIVIPKDQPSLEPHEER